MNNEKSGTNVPTVDPKPEKTPESRLPSSTGNLVVPWGEFLLARLYYCPNFKNILSCRFT